MSEFFQVLEQRRSIRKYEDRDVPEELVQRILEAVRWSPSWTNCQCWEIVVVRDAATKEKLQQTILPKNPATKAIVAAPVVLAVCGRLGVSGYYDNQPSTKFGDWYLFDLGIATQSLCLAAQDLGLGTVIVGLLDQVHADLPANGPARVGCARTVPVATVLGEGPTRRLPVRQRHCP